MVVAQLIERSLPTPEFCGLNLNIGKILSINLSLEKTKRKKRKAGNGLSFLINVNLKLLDKISSITLAAVKIFFMTNVCCQILVRFL